MPGFHPKRRQSLRAAAKAVLSQPEITPAIHDPADRMQEFMCACLGERVKDEYGHMMREEMGFADRRVKMVRPVAGAQGGQKPVLIVGAGESGMVLGYNLRELGIPFVIFERKRRSWAEPGLKNRYPGCAVDTPNHAYSFSFGSREPWVRYFSKRDALLSYMVSRSHEFWTAGTTSGSAPRSYGVTGTKTMQAGA